MNGDTQEHRGKPANTRHCDIVSSEAVTCTLNLKVTPLFEAAGNGDNERIKELLQRPDANINQPCFGKTALEASLIFRHESTALLLMDLGAELYFKDGSHALCAASYYGLKEVVHAAVRNGLDINKPFHGKHPILHAVNGGHADIEGEPVTGDSKNPFSVAWYQQNYDIFLLLLDASLTYKCCEERWEYSELLPQLHESDPRERLAERLAIWLKSTYWVPVDPDDIYVGPNMVIWRTLELVFGMGILLRGDSIIVRLLIEKKVPIPELVLVFLRRHWHGMKADPSRVSERLRFRPAILETIFTALPLISPEDEESLRIDSALRALETNTLFSKKTFPF
ncbi:hypothetical protein DER44DRAFT_827910 [Fusarium oxysporum]|nr:hypothetical protein DER44DRAFT_827910 [Fusarium oxysporum]